MQLANKQTRQLAIKTYNNGKNKTQQEVADLFGIHIRTFQRWLQVYREKKQLAPLPSGHRRPSFDKEGLKKLNEIVKMNPNATLEMLRIMTGTKASIMSVQRALHRLGFKYRRNHRKRKRVKLD